MSFGPLNGDGGERRLNVLITRARLRCEVFTNLTADDIDLDRTRSRGVRALKTFLAYAQGGRLDPSSGREASRLPLRGDRPGRARGVGLRGPTESPARRSTWPSRSRAAGTLPPGHRVRRPELPRRALGPRPRPAPAPGARIARLAAPARLEHRLGPQPGRRVERLLARLDEIKQDASLTPRTDAEPDLARYEREEPAAEPDAEASRVADYQLAALPDLANTDLGTIPDDRISAAVVAVVGTEGPVHVDEVARRIADAAGVKRLVSRTLSVLERACGAAVERGLVRATRRVPLGRRPARAGRARPEPPTLVIPEDRADRPRGTEGRPSRRSSPTPSAWTATPSRSPSAACSVSPA